MTTYKTKILYSDTLANQKANDPQNRQDKLPFPYSMIVDVLNETILFKLNLRMHEIEEKKKDKNYEGPVQEYVSQTIMDIEGISCLSKPSKSHNHLIAGDKAGNVYLLDLAKRAVFSKKQIAAGKKVIWIYDAIITDGDTSITTVAVINHSHHIITILRYRYSEPKFFITDEVIVAPDNTNPNILPYSCQLHDFCRLLTVKTYSGQILFFRLPELTLDIQKRTKTGSIPMEQQQIKKLLKYPLEMATLERQIKKISEKVLQINFKGEKVTPKYSDVKSKLLGMRKTVTAPVEQATKKDPKKKQQKKVEQVPQQKKQPQLIFNKKLTQTPLQQINGVDISLNYPLPQYQPYVYLIEESISMPKSKYFEKSKLVPLLNTIVYGWKGTKQFYIATISKPSLDQAPEFLNVGYHQQILNQAKSRGLKEYMSRKLQIEGEQVFKNVYEITATAFSEPDKSLIALGMKDGTIAVWNPLSKNLQFNTDKHSQAVTQIAFFQKWKLISGDASNEVFIHNVVNRTTQVKRTNIFEPKQPIPITDIQVNELGIAFCLDSQSNMRVFDLWRNQKISKVFPCTSYAMMEEKGKKWLPCQSVKNCTTLYSNRDFTVVLSVNWPSFVPRVEDRSQQDIKKLNEITQNPWRINGTNTHIVRNFEFLLNHFEGLQSVYKKGYQRKKIENLFSNLEFAQLRDRTFEIPDFSQPQEGQRLKKSNSINKSLFSGNRFSQNSFASSKSKQKSSKNSQSSNNKNVKLTNQVLHPEKFLFQRRKINKDIVITNESLVEWLRQQHSKKQVRQAKLNTQNGKTIF